MGIFFERTGEKSPLARVIGEALAEAPPADGQVQARTTARLGELAPLFHAVESALQMQPPDPSQVENEANVRTAAVANELLGGPKFNTGRFVITVVIFAAIVGAAVWTEAANLSTSPGVLFGFAGSLFGIVVGFLGGEKPS